MLFAEIPQFFLSLLQLVLGIGNHLTVGGNLLVGGGNFVAQQGHLLIDGGFLFHRGGHIAVVFVILALNGVQFPLNGSILFFQRVNFLLNLR